MLISSTGEVSFKTPERKQISFERYQLVFIIKMIIFEEKKKGEEGGLINDRQ